MAKNTPQQTIIVKKIINAAGHHGGAWKVAFADFMTAMMAFFLVMWLVSQSDEVKQNVASYFSGPSMLEHEFSSFGAKLTLEKLFLDLINEPLGTLQKLMQPANFTPNIIAMGNQEIVVHQIAAEMGILAKDVTVQQDKIEFSVYDYMLFQVGEAKISNQFVEVMEKVRKLVVGLENSVFTIDSEIFMETVPGRSIQVAEQVALQRAHILKKYVESAIKSPSVSVKVNTNVKKAEVLPPSGLPAGSITFSFQQKEFLPDGKSPRKINVNMGVEQIPQRVYEDIVNKIEEQRKRRRR